MAPRAATKVPHKAIRAPVIKAERPGHKLAIAKKTRRPAAKATKARVRKGKADTRTPVRKELAKAARARVWVAMPTVARAWRPVTIPPLMMRAMLGVRALAKVPRKATDGMPVTRAAATRATIKAVACNNQKGQCREGHALSAMIQL